MNQDFNDFYKNSNNEKNDNKDNYTNNINNSEINNNNKTKDVVLNSLSNVLNDKIKDNKFTKKGKMYYKILNMVIILIMILLIIPIIIIAKNMISRNDYTIMPIMLIIIIIIFQVLLLIAFIKLKNTKKGIAKGYKIFNNVAPLVINIFKNKNQDNESGNSNLQNSKVNDNLKDSNTEVQENIFVNYIGNKLNKNKTEKKELSNLEIWYNSILKATTIITIILWTIQILIMIKFIFDIATGVIKDPASVLGSGRLDLFGMFIAGYMISLMATAWLPMLIGLLVLYLVFYLILIVMALRVRNTKKRIIKWKDIIYLLFLYFDITSITIIFQLFNIDSLFIKIIISIIWLGVNINIILLIIILLKSEKKNN